MDRHDEILQRLNECFLTPEGMVYSALDKRTCKPPTEETFAGAAKDISELTETNAFDAFVEGYTRSELLSYENTGMTTSAALVAAVMEYKRTSSADVLERAKKLFKGIRRICEVGAAFEPGFITKYYGARFTYETSNDQCLYCICGMDAYYEIASSEEKSFIEKQIVAIAAFWMRHKYRYTYFQWKDMQWSPLRFPSLLTIAWKYSGDELFHKESNRIMSENIDCVPEFAMIPRYRNRRYSDFEEKNNVRYFSNMSDAVSMDIMNFSLLLRCDPESEFAPQWKKGIEMIWDEGHRVILPDGRCYTLALYRMEDGKTVEPGEDCPLPWAKTSLSTMIVRAGLQGLPYMPERREEIIRLARLVVNSLGPDDLTYCDELRHHPDSRLFIERLFSGDAISNWLWTWELLKAERAV